MSGNGFTDWLGGVRVLLVEAGGALAEVALPQQRWLASAGASVTTCRMNAASSLLRAESDRFDVILVDLDRDHGRQYWIGLRDAAPACACVCLASDASPALLREIRQASAGFVSKGAPVSDFMFVLRQACDLPLPDLRALAARAQRLWQLPPQQARLLYYNLWGYSNQEIADALDLSLHTVHEYQSELRRRCGARTKSDYQRLLQEHAGRHPEMRLASSPLEQ